MEAVLSQASPWTAGHYTPFRKMGRRHAFSSAHFELLLIIFETWIVFEPWMIAGDWSGRLARKTAGAPKAKTINPKKRLLLFVLKIENPWVVHDPTNGMTTPQFPSIRTMDDSLFSCSELGMDALFCDDYAKTRLVSWEAWGLEASCRNRNARGWRQNNSDATTTARKKQKKAMDIIFGSWKEQRRVCFCHVLQAKMFYWVNCWAIQTAFEKADYCKIWLLTLLAEWVNRLFQ